MHRICISPDEQPHPRGECDPGGGGGVTPPSTQNNKKGPSGEEPDEPLQQAKIIYFKNLNGNDGNKNNGFFLTFFSESSVES